MNQLQQGSNAVPNILTPQDSLFYNRLAEQTKFLKMFSDKPGLISVLVGPPNCGKTAFLKNLIDQMKAKPDPPLILMIDSRLDAVTGPEEISKALCDAVVSENFTERAQSAFSAFAGLALSSTVLVNAPGAEVLVPFKDIKDSFAKDQEHLPETLQKLDALFEKLKGLSKKPVIIIDEANNLMDWNEADTSNPNLKKLLNFFTVISKQDKLAHVVLATSDYFLASWFSNNGLTNDKFKVEVLGDLTEQEARCFLYGNAVGSSADALGEAASGGTWHGIVNDPSEPNQVPPGAEEQWPAIYERFGGNIGLLIQCVAAARVETNWEVAFRSVASGPYLTIDNAFKPRRLLKRNEAPLWTGEQWTLVLQKIVTSPHHAILREDLEKNLDDLELGSNSGEEILLSMVKYNLLALRPPSDLARDLPKEVYGDDELNMVVTLPLPVHVWAAKKLLERRSLI